MKLYRVEVLPLLHTFKKKILRPDELLLIYMLILNSRFQHRKCENSSYNVYVFTQEE